MEQKPVRKLSLKKKTITRLSETEAQNVNGGSIYYSGVCATDFTRIFQTLACATVACVTAACGSDFTRPGP